MNGLRTARVVVIDDTQAEAAPILAALGRAGVGALYVQPTEDLSELPDEPQSGIRVVFLDLRLYGDSDDPKQFMPSTVAILEKVVNIDPVLTGIFCWSKREDDVADLKEQLERKRIKPAYIVELKNKIAFVAPQNDDAEKDLEELIGVIDENMATNPACQLVWQWEQSIHDSTTAVSEDLFGEIGEVDYEEVIVDRLARVAVTTDPKCLTKETTADAICAGLGPLHLDRVMSQSHIDPEKCESIREKVRELKRPTAPKSPETTAFLNGVLLYAPCKDSTPWPGNLYVDSGWPAGTPFPGPSVGGGIRGMLKQLFPPRPKGYEGHDDVKYDAFIKSLEAGAISCVVEITPACDATKDLFQPRLICGVLVPWKDGDDTDENNRSTTIPHEAKMAHKEIQVAIINKEQLPDSYYKLYLCAKRVCWIEHKKLKKIKPIARLRHEVLTDIRGWFAGHAARPGYTSA